MDWVKTTTIEDDKHLSLWFGAAYTRGFTVKEVQYKGDDWGSSTAETERGRIRCKAENTAVDYP